MRARFSQYLNEIVSLTIMGLMCVALVAGQAEATPQRMAEAAVEQADTSALELRDDQRLPNFLEDRLRIVDNADLEIDITFRFRHTGE